MALSEIQSCTKDLVHLISKVLPILRFEDLGKAGPAMFYSSFFGIVRGEGFMWSMGFGEEGGEQLAPDGGGEMGASLAEAFLPVRPFARSFGCFPCLHSKRRLAKKIRTSVAAGGAHPPGPDRLFWHITGWRAARTVRLVQNFFASRLMLCRHGKQPGARRRKRPRLTSSPLPPSPGHTSP